MTPTKSEIAENIKRLAPLEIAKRSRFSQDIEHMLEVQTENEEYRGTPNYCDAVFQAEDFSVQNDDRSTLRLARLFLIEAKFYRVMPQEEIDRTWRSSGTKWDFKIDGVPYTGDHCYESIVECDTGVQV